jgi:IS605 OrfB family transposase
MIRTFKYRLKDKSARRLLVAHAIACNQVWNWAVAQHRDRQARYWAGAPRRPWPTAFDLTKECKGVGALLGLHQQSVASVCVQFARSRDLRKKVPRFRSSFGRKRARGWVPFMHQTRQTSGNSITYLGHTYRFFGSKRRPLPATAKGGAFVEDALGRWWVCFTVESDDIAPQQAVGAVGIDLGLKALATTSNGEVIDNPRHFRVHAERLATVQRAGNKRRAAAIHTKIANARRDHHHKISTRLARSYAFIAVGDVNAKRLAKTRMAKSVTDAGWSTFRAMLAYKASAYVEVDESFTTQTCSSCGSLPPERPKGIAGLGVRVWSCSSCGEDHDRDVNAAKNILRLGLSVRPLVEESRRAA